MISYTLEQKLDEFNSFMKKHGIEYTMGGSIALVKHGLNLNRECHDFDIEAVLDTEEKVKLIKELADVSTLCNYGEFTYSFEFRGVTVNLFQVDTLNMNTVLWQRDIPYQSIPTVLLHKGKYNRQKDITDLTMIIKNLFGAYDSYSNEQSQLEGLF